MEKKGRTERFRAAMILSILSVALVATMSLGPMMSISLQSTSLLARVYAAEMDLTDSATSVPVDLAVRELRFSSDQPEVGTAVEITTLILNLSNFTVPMTTVFVIDEKLIKTDNSSIPRLGFQFLYATWEATKGNHTIRVQVSPARGSNVEDVLIENNVLRRNLNVEVPSYAFTIAISGNLFGQTRLFVDNVFWGSCRGGESVPVVFEKTAALHNMTVDHEVRPAFGVKYVTEKPTIFVNETGKHTFDYQAFYLLQVATPPELELFNRSEWYPAGSTATMPFFQPTIEKTDKPGTRWIFRSWNIDGRVFSHEQPQVFMNTTHFAQISYETQHYLTIKWQNNENRCASVLGEGWYPEGSTVSIAPFPSGCWWYEGLGWWLGLQSNASASPHSLIIKEPTTLQISWTDPSGVDFFRAIVLLSGWIIVVAQNLEKIMVFSKSAPRRVTDLLSRAKSRIRKRQQ